MDNINPATKQYLMFSFVIAVIFSFIVNFGLIDLVRGTFAFGFPLSLNGAEGLTELIYRIINTIVLGLFFAIPIFYILKELNRRR